MKKGVARAGPFKSSYPIHIQVLVASVGEPWTKDPWLFVGYIGDEILSSYVVIIS